ncbi:MAG: HEAT repeat domain-containing protein [Planctomycetaceae bacterium]|nr:HEAT repeat domain-containing protein [Planctomycetaceae bacterium]
MEWAGELPDDSIPLFVNVSRDSIGTVRRAACWCLGYASGWRAKEQAQAALLARLEDRDAAVRRAALFSLATLGLPADAIDRTLPLLKDTDNNVRAAAVLALGSTATEGRGDRRVVSLLVKALDDPSHDVRGATVNAFWRMGPNGQLADEALVRKLSDSQPLVRTVAAAALTKVWPQRACKGDVIGILVQALKGQDPTMANWAANALHQLGPAAAPASEALLARLADPNNDTANEVLQTLQEIGPVLAPQVGQVLKETSARRRAAAAFLVAQWSLLAKGLPQQLTDQALGDTDAAVRLSAVRQLTTTPERTQDKLVDRPAIVRQLCQRVQNDPDARVRAEALRRMPTTFPPEEGIWQAMKVAAADKDKSVREHAAAALKSMEEDRTAAALGEQLKRPQAKDRARAAGRVIAAGLAGRLHRELAPVLLELRDSADLRSESGVDWPEAACSAMAEILRQDAPARLVDQVKSHRQFGEGVSAALYREALAATGHPRLRGAQALLALGDPRAAEIAIAALKDNEEEVRKKAVRVVALAGSGERITKALAAASGDQGVYVRSDALEALAKMGRPAGKSLPSLFRQSAKIRAKSDWPSSDDTIKTVKSVACAAVGDLVEAMKDPDPVVRREAAWTAGQIKASCAAVGQALMAALKDEDKSVRLAAAQSLGELSYLSRDYKKHVMNTLLAQFESQGQWQYLSAAASLLDHDTFSPSARAAIFKATDSPDAEVRAAGARGLGCLIGLSTPRQDSPASAPSGAADDRAIVAALVRLSGDRDDKVRLAAVSILIWRVELFSRDAQVLDALRKRAADPVAAIRCSAISGLGHDNVSERERAELLEQALKDVDEDVRRTAIESLFQAAVAQGRADLIERVLNLRDEHEVLYAFRVLGDMAQSDGRYLPELKRLCRHPRIMVRRHAASSLPQGEGTPAMLIDLLDDESSVVASAALAHLDDQKELWRSDPAIIDKALPALCRCLKDPDISFRGGAANMLQYIGPQGAVAAPLLARGIYVVEPYYGHDSFYFPWQAAVPELLEALKHLDWRVRLQAMQALKEIDPLPQDAIVAIMERLNGDDDPAVRKSAEQVFEKVRIATPEQVGAAATVLKSDQPKLRRTAAQALSAFVQTPDLFDDHSVRSRRGRRLAIEALVGLVDDPDEEVALAAVNGLAKTENQRAKEALVRASKSSHAAIRLAAGPPASITDPDPRVRAAAADLMREDSDVPALVKALEDKDEDVRLAAALAIWNVRTDSAAMEAALPVLVAVLKERLGCEPSGSPDADMGRPLRKSIDAEATKIVRSLAWTGSLARPAADTVIELLIQGKLDDEDVAYWLENVGVEPVSLPRLIAMLKDPARTDVAAKIIRSMGAKGAPAAPVLVEAFKANRGAAEDVLSALAAVDPGRAMQEAPAIIALMTAEPCHVDDSMMFKPSPSAPSRICRILVEIGAPAVPLLLEALKHKDARVRRDAAATLRRIDPLPVQAVEPLLAALKDGTWTVRLQAAESLIEIAPDRPEALDTLLDLLTWDDVQARSDAMRSLWQMGPLAAPVKDDLLKLAGGQDKKLAAMALQALGRIAPDSPGLLAVAGDSLRNDDTSRTALRILIQSGSAAKPYRMRVVECQSFLNSTQLDTFLLATCLSRQEVLDDLPRDRGSSGWQYHRDKWVQANSSRLAELGGLYISLLASDSDDMAGLAASRLSQLGPGPCRQAMKALIKTLKRQGLEREDWLCPGGDRFWTVANVRSAAAEALGQIGSDAAAAVPALMDALKDRSQSVRASAAMALGSIGPAAAEAVPLLNAMLSETDLWSLAPAAAALGNIGPKASTARADLEKLLAHDDMWVQLAAAEALLKIAPAHQEALGLLESIARDVEDDRRFQAACAIAQCPAQVDKGIALLEALEGPTEEVVKILAALGPKGKAALSRLCASGMDSPDAIKELLRVDPSNTAPLQKLASAAMDRSIPVRRRRESIWTLGEVGPVAKTLAVAALEQALGDPDIQIRSAGADALATVDPENELLAKVLVAKLTGRDPSQAWDGLLKASKLKQSRRVEIMVKARAIGVQDQRTRQYLHSESNELKYYDQFWDSSATLP